VAATAGTASLRRARGTVIAKRLAVCQSGWSWYDHTERSIAAGVAEDPGEQMALHGLQGLDMEILAVPFQILIDEAIPIGESGGAQRAMVPLSNV
jgi:hypothetical protein